MSIPKVIGIEQEYAISVKGVDSLSAFHASCMLVNAYARKAGIREPGISVLWDYGHETPFRDIRGDLFGRKTARDVTTKEDNLLINAILPNGARLYTDHAHPEYSTPECLSAREVAACDKAGELILNEAVRLAKKILPGAVIKLFKNNIDHQGQSYGCHENYLMDAKAHQGLLGVNPERARRSLIPFLVTRQIFAGSGKPGVHFEISQRARFMECLFGLDTMFNRPLINTRQEHHADPKRFRRLHLILGDANMNDFSTMLKVGTTQIVLQMLEDDFIASDFSLRDELGALRQISLQYDCEIEMADGRKTSAIALQRRFLELARTYCLRPDTACVPEADLLLENWSKVLDGLENLKLSRDFDLEDDPEELRRKLDWVLKLWLFTRYRRKKNLDWNHPQLKILDLQYHNIDRDEGIYYSLLDQGIAQSVLDEAEVAAFVEKAPSSTRAWFRSRCLQKFGREVYLVNWEVVGFDHGDIHRMVPLLNPLKGTRSRFEEVFEKAGDSKELLGLMEKMVP